MYDQERELIKKVRSDLSKEKALLAKYIRAVNGRISTLPRVVKRRYNWVRDVDFYVGRLDLFIKLGATEDFPDVQARLEALLDKQPLEVLPPVKSLSAQ